MMFSRAAGRIPGARPRVLLAGLAALCGIVGWAPTSSAQVRPNVRAVEVIVPNAPILAGAPIDIAVDVALEDGAFNGMLQWRVWLSEDGNFAGARALDPVAEDRLLLAGIRRFQTQVSAPPGVTGLFFVGVQLDPNDQILEGNELDNRVMSASRIRLRNRQPDLRVADVDAQPSRLTVGDAVSINATVRNAGDASVSTVVAAFLSSDATVSTSDVEIGRTTVTLAAGASQSLVIDGRIPSAAPAGAYYVGVQADPEAAVAELVENNNGAITGDPITVVRPSLSFVDPTLPAGTLGVPYDARLYAEGGDGQYVFEVVMGDVPPGLTLADDGMLEGQPMMTGTFDFTVEVTSDGRSAERMEAVEIVGTGQALQIVWDEAATGFRGLPYRQAFVAGGGEPPYRWTALNGELPLGLTFGGNGVLRGVPQAFGEWTFEVQVEDRLGAQVTAMVAIEVTSPSDLTIGQQTLTPIPVGVSAEIALTVVGGVAPYTWTSLTPAPPGLTLTADGRFTGTPNRVGMWPVRVRVTDGKRQPSADDAVVRISVEPSGDFDIVTTVLPVGQVRSNYETFIEASGGQPPYRWQIVPGTSLPEGFFLTDADGTTGPADAGRLFGRSLVPVDQAFAVRVEDAQGRRREAALVLSLDVVGGTDGSGGCRCQRPPASAFAAWWLWGLAGWLVHRGRNRGSRRPS